MGLKFHQALALHNSQAAKILLKSVIIHVEKAPNCIHCHLLTLKRSSLLHLSCHVPTVPVEQVYKYIMASLTLLKLNSYIINHNIYFYNPFLHIFIGFSNSFPVNAEINVTDFWSWDPYEAITWYQHTKKSCIEQWRSSCTIIMDTTVHWRSGPIKQLPASCPLDPRHRWTSSKFRSDVWSAHWVSQPLLIF